MAIARQYQGNGVDIEDLISEGNIAMLQAAYKYDASKSQGRFVSFALPFIRKSMEKALSDTQFVFSVDAPAANVYIIPPTVVIQLVKI